MSRFRYIGPLEEGPTAPEEKLSDIGEYNVGMSALNLGHVAVNQLTDDVSAEEEWNEPILPTFEPIRDAGISLTDEQIKNPTAIIKTIELQHYARQMPRFAEQVQDETRTNIFKYRPSIDHAPVAITEHEALVETKQTLAKMREAHMPEEYYHEIKDIEENLSFLGEKELNEACPGMGILWRDYLNEHPENKLFIKTLKTGGEQKIPKSGPYIIGRILDSFTDEELAVYKGRIVDLDDPEKLSRVGVDPEHMRIVAVDDSSISGNQLGLMLDDLDTPDLEPYMVTMMENRGVEKTEFLRLVEINLLVAPRKLLEDGFKIYSSVLGRAVHVPVKAYYKAHDVDGHVRTTSVYSSMDYGFENTIRDAIVASDTYRPMPPLTYIERPYHNGELPRVVIEGDGTLRRTNQSR